MVATSESQYETALNELEGFIQEEYEERAFLIDWISFWNRQRENFSAAYKNLSAPRTNKSESYNSKYVRMNEIKLKLLDAAKLDASEALQFERTFKKYGEGMPVAGTGPSGSQRMEKDLNDQRKRSRKYADATLHDIDHPEDVQSKVPQY